MIYLKIKRGEFPQPINLGARAVAWLESEIDTFIASLIVKGRTETFDLVADEEAHATPESTVKFQGQHARMREGL
jgi:6,7-dimethyl-8-ribityllumazine synthase